jgi:murein DD-endopeptidase MepM/ murein hydrolase activator NlpD
MRPLLEWCSAVALSRFSIAIPIAIGVVGCSDSSRFNDPFANPYAARGPGPEVTSSVPPAQPAPIGRVDAQPLGVQPMPPPGPAGAPSYPGGPSYPGAAGGPSYPGPAGGPSYYGYGPRAADLPPRGPEYGPRGPDYAPRPSDYSPPNYPPRPVEYPPPNYPPRAIGEYPPRGTEYPGQAPGYPPRGAEYPPRAPDYPPRGPDYGPRGPDYPPTGMEGGPRPDTTGAVSSPSGQALARGSGSGTTVTVGPGDTINRIAKRYGLSPAALMAANHISAPATIRRGQQIIIPRSPGTAVAVSQPMPPMSTQVSPSAAIAPAPQVPAAGAGEGIHVVAAGETLSSIAHHYHRSRGAIAKANNIEADAKLHIAQRLVIPGARPTSVRIGGLEPTSPGRPPASQGGIVPAVAQSADTGPPPPPATEKVAASAQAPSARVTTATTSEPLGEDVTTEKSSKTAAVVAPQFRWPVHGRIISGFGPQAAGQPNDGINVAVPEGTAVKAADDGIVAYAGNELKGYGNLILVRHQNGFVTAYANASELMVRRGETVKRGQVIARSGQTGTVTSPQLHFEIRKGATPVDPTQYLSGT